LINDPSPPDPDLLFHIVFTPGTVRYLRLATLSLLEFSPYRYRLVANGLQADELRQLKRFCDSQRRLEYFAYPTRKMLFHSTLISILESMDKSEFFCFADSDIFATAPFHEELNIALRNYDVFSSGGRIGFSPEERASGIAGPLVETDAGLPLATTFFAIYRRESLQHVIEKTGISFERYSCREQIPEYALSCLNEMGIPQESFDTGKLMNILGSRFNMRFRYQDLDALLHIGGLTQGFELANAATQNHKLAGLRLFKKPSTIKLPRAVSARLGKPQRRRLEVGFFFATYLAALIDERALPEIPAAIAVDKRIQRNCAVILGLYERYRELLKD
jgi:hypothetical protein